MAAQGFTNAELQTKIGKRVRFLARHHAIPYGTVGVIRQLERVTARVTLYAVTVQWEDETEPAAPRSRSRYLLTKTEFKRYFQECD